MTTFKSKVIKDAVRRKDTDYFYFRVFCNLQIYDESDVTCVQDLNFGDGNSRTLTLRFSKLDCYVTLEGIHSSFSDPHWTRVYFSHPYEYKEIRYREHFDTLDG